MISAIDSRPARWDPQRALFLSTETCESIMAWINEQPSTPESSGTQPSLVAAIGLLTGWVTAALLLGSVGLRVEQDASLFKGVGSLSDPVVAALLAVEVVPLAIGAALGLAAALITWFNWAKNRPIHKPTVIVFSLVLLGGLFVGMRAVAPEFMVGWLLVLLSGVRIVLEFSRRMRLPTIQH